MKKIIFEKNIKKNDEFEVVIERLGVNGEGIATKDGVVIFVPFALPGERVLIHIINDKNSFLIAKIVKILEQSPERIEPKCPHFFKCGGCDLQHMLYENQLNFKKKLVEDTLKKYAKIDCVVDDVVPSNVQFGYRNKFAFPVAEIDGKIQIGMYQKASHKIVAICNCLLQTLKNKDIIEIFKKFLTENKISVFNEETKKGLVKHIVVREHCDSFIMTIVLAEDKKIDFEPLILMLQKKFSSFGLYKNINKLDNNVIFGEKDVHIFGLKELEIEEFGIKYFVNNRSFLQVNDYVKSKIYTEILNVLGSQKNVIDAYSGAGLLSSVIAKTGANVFGVEIVKEATKNANNLKIINNLKNLENINGDCAKIIPILAKKLKGNFSVVVDPARKGLDREVVDAFFESKPKQIVYLSCNPATLARDLELLKGKFEIVFVKPYDMFPQTANVETLVSLRLRDV